jgi:hypothetical protein
MYAIEGMIRRWYHSYLRLYCSLRGKDFPRFSTSFPARRDYVTQHDYDHDKTRDVQAFPSNLRRRRHSIPRKIIIPLLDRRIPHRHIPPLIIISTKHHIERTIKYIIWVG